MGEFFNGWRRKTGCVLLVMAALLTGAWLRSYVFLDEISFHMLGTSGDIDSERGKLAYIRSSLQSSSTVARYSHELKDLDRGSTWLSVYDSPATTHWRWEYGGFLFCESTNHHSRVWAIPYWSFVLPISLLSAYLILWPGKRKAAQPTQNSTAPTSDLQS